MTQSDQIQKLIADFADSVAKQTDAIALGDARKGNQFARRYVAIFRKLRAFGDIGRDSMVQLLTYPRGDVRVAAACYLLRYRTEQSLEVLRTEMAGKGFVAFEAAEAINRWKDGTWNLDPA